MFENSRWIWAENSEAPNTRVNFKKKIYLTDIPRKAVLNIGCETKYWLFVNGKLAIFDGGLFRESIPGCGYFDEVNISKYLKCGNNEIVWHVWYFGNGGRNNSFCEKGGLIYECKALNLYSSKNDFAEIDIGYYNTEILNPSYLYGGHNTAYNAEKKEFTLCPILSEKKLAFEIGKYGDKPWGELLKRPIPALFFTNRKAKNYQKIENLYYVKLPHAMQFSPYFIIEAKGGEKIDICSDRYEVNGGPGDNQNVYRGHRAEYICREGKQEFEMLDWIFGEQIIFSIPESVKVYNLGYRESGFNCKVKNKYNGQDPMAKKLFKKSIRTLLCCMRENYMDCPDRERGQWIGDVSVQATQVVNLLDENAKLLLRKSICDFINLRKGDILVGNVPGDNSGELPSQSLNAISELGMIATYYRATKEKEILQMVFEPAVRYLKLWSIDVDGLLEPRKGDWRWFDHLFNIDEEVLEHCWYYSALSFVRYMAQEIHCSDYDEFINNRMVLIRDNFEKRYWKGKYFSSGDFVDDRANAMAVLSGLCPKEKYKDIAYVLMSVFSSTTYMENYVLLALCEMGYKQEAYRRMMSRYQPLIENGNTTLWEDFFHLGTRNHAWSGGPAYLLIKYFNEKNN